MNLRERSATFEEDWERYKRAIIRVIAREICWRRGDWQDIEIVAQEGAWKHWHRYDSSKSDLITWMTNSALSEVHHWIRDHRGTIRIPAWAQEKRIADLPKTCELSDETEEYLGGADPTAALVDNAAVDIALARLPERSAMIVRRYAEGFSYSEIAAALGFSANYIYTIRTRAISRLRRIYAIEQQASSS